mgnify:FL=1
MKKIISILIIGIIIIILIICLFKKERTDMNIENTNINNKSLVLYFSATNNTEQIAKYISEITSSDILEIIPKDVYTNEDLDYNNNNSRANREQNDKNARPKISNKLDLENYDIIYLGYPIWWEEEPRIILTLLDNYNLENKTIIPFCTSGGSGIELSVNNIRNYNNKLNVLDGKRFSSNSSKEEVITWINSLNINNNSNSKSAKLLIDNTEYIITLEDNETVDALVNNMPLDLSMSNLNGNEFYSYLDFTLPTNSYDPGKINKGDIYLYGNNCLVIFYESFNTSYSYTKIGKLDNIEVLDNIKDKNNIIVSLEIN